MKAYTYGDSVYFRNRTGIPNEHHNNFILNQIHDMYIISPLKFMDEIFESLPNLSVDKMIKIDECPNKKYGSVIKSKFREQRESSNRKNV